MSPSTDGRLARGAERRRSIIEATLATIEADGVAGLTHRKVAERAGVRPSLVVYHFATLDDLLVVALTTAADGYAAEYAALRATGLDAIEAIATMIASSRGPGRSRALAERELTLQAARRPALRPAAGRWRDLVASAAREHTTDPMAIQTAVATADGLCATVLLSSDATAPTAGDVEHLIRRTLTPPA